MSVKVPLPRGWSAKRAEDEMTNCLVDLTIDHPSFGQVTAAVEQAFVLREGSQSHLFLNLGVIHD